MRNKNVNKIVILGAGKKGTGKTTTANAIIEMLKNEGIKVKAYSFGKQVKDIANDLLENKMNIIVSLADKEKIRPIYQAIGMIGRNVKGKKYWLDIVYNQINNDFNKDLVDVAIIDDARFENELEYFDYDFKTIKFKMDRTSIYDISDDDETETGLDNYPEDKYDILIRDTDKTTMHNVMQLITKKAGK